MTSGRTVLLVEDGSGSTALAAARALDAAGWRVVVATAGGRSAATASRSCAASEALPALTSTTGQGWLEAVREAARRAQASVVVPCGDAELLVLSEGREQLPDVLVPYPEHQVVLTLLDKVLLARAARSRGISTPLTEPARPGALASTRGPVVVKPRLHGPALSQERLEAHVTDDPERARVYAEAIRVQGGDPLYQPYVPGQLVAAVVVRGRSGERLAGVHQVAMRTYPVPAGSSVRGELVDAPPGLTEAVDDLLESIGWWGLVQLELIQDRAGALHLLDANPRPYGTLALAEGAGAGLCRAWLADAQGTGGASAGAARPTRFQSFGLDLRRALDEPAERRRRELVATLRFAAARPVRPVWSASDPLPFLALVVTVAKRVVARRRGRARRGARSDSFSR